MSRGWTWIRPSTLPSGNTKHTRPSCSDLTLKNFLTARADAFMSDNYYASDVAWMDLDSPIDVTIGQYETYEAELFRSDVEELFDRARGRIHVRQLLRERCRVDGPGFAHRRYHRAIRNIRGRVVPI